MIAALISLLLAVGAHLSPAAATVETPHELVGTPAPPPATVGGVLGGPSLDVDEPTCLAGEEWDGLRCVALQRPEETSGRQIDCADGVTVGVMVNGIVTGCR